MKTLKNFRKKKRKMRILNSLIVTKNVKGGPFGIFTSILLQNIRKIEGGFFREIEKFSKKSLIMPKKLKGGPFCLARYCYVTLKEGTTFMVQFLGPNGPIGHLKILQNFVTLLSSVRVD